MLAVLCAVNLPEFPAAVRILVSVRDLIPAFYADSLIEIIIFLILTKSYIATLLTSLVLYSCIPKLIAPNGNGIHLKFDS